MTLEEQIMKLQTYKMFEGEDTVYVERDNVLKLLEQEPCEDCISREAVLIELDKYLCGVPFDEKGIDEVIKELPLVTSQPRWIPVSEGLPKEAESVLVYAERNAYDDKGKFRKKVIDIGWQVDGRWHIDGCSGVDGMAWMPLPQPYTEGSGEE